MDKLVSRQNDCPQHVFVFNKSELLDHVCQEALKCRAIQLPHHVLDRDGGLPFSMRRGLLAFFMRCRTAGVYSESRALKRFRTQPPFIQSLAITYLADADFRPNAIVVDLIHSKSPAPGIVLAAQLVQRGLSVTGLGVKLDSVAPEVKNVFQGLGLIPGQKATRFDQIGDVLRNRYGIVYWRYWKMLLGNNYQHGLELLLSADVKFLSDRSGWLSYQNSFNDAVFRAFQAYLTSENLPGAVKTVGNDGNLIAFGVLLDPHAPFAKAHGTLAAYLRSGNHRRNSIPSSHPFETKGGKKTKPLRIRERDALKERFKTAYAEIIAFVNAHGVT